LPSETMIWQPEFTDKTLSRKPGAVHSPDLSRNVSTLFRTGHIFEIKLNGADFFFFSKHVSSPESPGNRPHPHYCLISLALTAILLSLEDA
ncbi:hypothetical protein, partial [Escherichia coli]|uniref:hypothetical protein n=1 Tax=Escherichia coli TaxID=562 RepID=UPI001BEB9300